MVLITTVNGIINQLITGGGKLYIYIYIFMMIPHSFHDNSEITLNHMSLAGYILVAVSIGAFLGALTVLVAARRGAFGVAKRSTATGEPDAVDPVTPADVSVQLSALDETEKNVAWFF